MVVLNLIISGMPSILETWKLLSLNKFYVLNLIISGMPSILKTGELSLKIQRVLNLIISGMPSIHMEELLGQALGGDVF